MSEFTESCAPKSDKPATTVAPPSIEIDDKLRLQQQIAWNAFYLIRSSLNGTLKPERIDE